MKKVLLVLTLTLSLVFGAATLAYAAPEAPTIDTIDTVDGRNAEMSSTDVDNDIINANDTGRNVTTNDGTTLNNVIKSENMVMEDGAVKSQRTHGDYQANTNSCASCHQTHTAASENLLFKDGVYNTCAACHDGTLGFYNVFQPSMAGTFGGTTAGNMSVHLSTGAVAIKAAPGGNPDGNASNFNCASCHAPHGSYSDRLLDYNPGDAAVTDWTLGGNQVATGTLYTYGTIPSASADADRFVVVKDTAGNASDGSAVADAVYEGEITDTTTTVVEVFKLAENHGRYSYAPSKQPWMAGDHYSGGPVYYTELRNTTTGDKFNEGTMHEAGANHHIDFVDGYAFGSDLVNVNEVLISQAYRVNLLLTNDPTAPAGFEDIVFTSDDTALWNGTLASGSGVAVSYYCAACHFDYMNASGDDGTEATAEGTGIFTRAYRHTTTRDSYTCLRCHYAHGTDVTVMKDAKGNTVADLEATGMTNATDYMLDQNPSSALKKYTNMAVCWGCHTSSHPTDLVNDDYYWENNSDLMGLENEWSY